MRIRRIGLTHYHDGRFVVTTARHVAGILATDLLNKIFLAAEKHLYVFVETSSPIETGVDHYSVTMVVSTENVGVYGTEARIVHSLDVNITESASREFLHLSGTSLHPSLVKKSIER